MKIKIIYICVLAIYKKHTKLFCHEVEGKGKIEVKNSCGFYSYLYHLNKGSVR